MNGNDILSIITLRTQQIKTNTEQLTRDNEREHSENEALLETNRQLKAQIDENRIATAHHCEALCAQLKIRERTKTLKAQQSSLIELCDSLLNGEDPYDQEETPPDLFAGLSEPVASASSASSEVTCDLEDVERQTEALMGDIKPRTKSKLVPKRVI